MSLIVVTGAGIEVGWKLTGNELDSAVVDWEGAVLGTGTMLGLSWPGLDCVSSSNVMNAATAQIDLHSPCSPAPLHP